MRVLVSTTAGAGHFGPLVPFARACLSAGHEVAVAAPASFAAEVSAAGLEHRPFADSPPELLGPIFGRLPTLSFEAADALVVSEVFGRVDAQAALPGLVQTIDQWRPDLVLREPAEFGSLAAARSAGVPQAVVAIGMTALGAYVERVAADALAELDGVAGLPEGTAVTAMRAAPTFTSVPVALDSAVADSGDGPGPVHRFRTDGRRPRPEAAPEGWGDPSHPLVYVSFGSVAGNLGPFAHVFPAVLSAFADQPVRILLTTGSGVDPADLAPVPPNAKVLQWWPQEDVMPYAAAVVGHGGFGTTMTAVVAGVPQVVLPLFSADQRINAEHVAAAGAGLLVDGGPAGTESLPEAVARLLADPSYRDAAGALAEQMAALPPVTEAVPALEAIASS